MQSREAQQFKANLTKVFSVMWLLLQASISFNKFSFLNKFKQI